jgi:hypothetical protein
MKPSYAAALTPESRSAQLHAGVRLEAISVIWNIAEGMIAVAAGRTRAKFPQQLVVMP